MTTAASAVQTQTRQRPWWLTLISGILAVIIGATLLWGGLGAKVQTYMLLVTFLGIWWMVQGIFDIIAIFIDHSMWGWKLFIGIVSIMAGFYILSYPIVSAIALPKIFVLVLGIWGLMYGIILLIMAFQGGGWGAGILGVLGIIFGIALMANYYVVGMGLAMLWTAALFAFFGGFVMIFQAFKQRA
ncbi:MAG: DUF308 domain-containing protein [Bacteroidota bacterium]|jgi:uncharacterized membrane protein HdeD (DUF308 family)